MPLHSELWVQPGRQLKLCGSQMGCAVPQSELARHATQRPSRKKQRGSATGQSLLLRHSTHSPSVVLQSVAFCCCVQSVAPLHWTQSPPLQTGMLFGHVPVLHVAWHW